MPTPQASLGCVSVGVCGYVRDAQALATILFTLRTRTLQPDLG